MTTLNTPYVKQYNESGKVSNPLNGGYIHNSPNRRQRRTFIQKNPFTGNHKGHKLTVSGNKKYERVVQVIIDQFGKVINRVNHFISK